MGGPKEAPAAFNGPSAAALNAPCSDKSSHGKAHPTLGINADRSCSDKLALLLWILIWLGFGYFCITIFKAGDPDRLLLGTDYLGNICGRGSPNVTVAGNWSQMRLLWYPITFDLAKKKLLVKEALKLGICVPTCPAPVPSSSFLPRLTMIDTYGTVSGNASVPAQWPVLFRSRPSFGRCLPNFFSFDCQNSSDCLQTLLNSNDTFANAEELTETLNQGIDEFRTGWPSLVAGVTIAIVFSFIWLLVLRRLVKPVVVLTGILVFVGLGFLGYVFWAWRASKLAEDPPQLETAKYLFIAAIVTWVLDFIFLCVVIFIHRDVLIACDVIEEATKVPVSIPSMVLIPVVSFVAIIPFVVLALGVALYIQSCGDVLSITLPRPIFSLNGTTTNLTAANGAATAMALANTTVEVKQYEFKNWRIYGHLGNIFMFLWAFGLINAIAFMTISLCAVFWYFSAPGDNKDPPTGAVIRAAGVTLRYHLGTLAFGSFIVALIQTIRIACVVIEQKLREAGLDGDQVKFLMKILHCILACLERVVKFINKNAYIVCSMNGKSFIPAAREALELLVSNALSVGAVTVIGEIVMTFGKVLITVVSGISVYYINKAMGYDQGLTGGMILVVIVLFLAFLVACLFTSVFSVCIDTILLCYCKDKTEVEPAYAPDDLKSYIGNAQKRALEKNASEAAKHEKALKQLAHPMTTLQKHVAGEPDAATKIGGLEML